LQLSDALELVMEVADSINTAVRTHQQNRSIMEIQQLLTEKLDLLKPGYGTRGEGVIRRTGH